jgi:hypothetical protein
MLMSKQADDPLIPTEQTRRNTYERSEIEHPTMQSFGGRKIKQKVVVNVTQVPLDRYFRRNQITEAQHKAGSTLFVDWYNSGLSPRITSDPGRMNVGEATYGMAATERQAYHRKRFREAAAKIPDMARKEVCQACCDQEPIGKGAPMEILRRGLDVLVRHYGY